jgi:hypothetical protein
MAMQRRTSPQFRIKFALACAIVVVVAVAASATHLLHVADVLPNAHNAAGMTHIDRMDPSLVRLAAGEVSEHPYCSVEGLLPPSANALPLNGAFCRARQTPARAVGSMDTCAAAAAPACRWRTPSRSAPGVSELSGPANRLASVLPVRGVIRTRGRSAATLWRAAPWSLMHTKYLLVVQRPRHDGGDS